MAMQHVDAPTGEVTFDDEDAPLDHYGVSKQQAEQELLRLSAGSPISLTVLRIPLVYGVGQKGNLATLFKLVERGVPLPLKSVTNMRSLVSVQSVTTAIEKILLHAKDGSRRYYLDDCKLSTASIIERMAAAGNKQAKLFPLPERLVRFLALLLGRSEDVDKLLGSLIVDSTQFPADYDWRPCCSFDKVMKAIAIENE